MMQYWTKAAALLYLIHTTSSLTTQSSPSSSSQFPARDSRITPQSAPSSLSDAPVPTSTSPTRERRTGGDLFTEVIVPRKPKAKKRKRPDPHAPVVDSALLRFLSKQKQEGKITLEDTVVVEPESAATAASKDEQHQKEYETAESWLGQYNSNRVARLLMECKVDEKTALKAGQVVQNHVLARTARRRVRDFLKKREIEWVSGDGAINAIEQSSSSSSPALPDYGLREVINLLLESGLKGNDIAAILTHSPSVALMMPRRKEQKSTAASFQLPKEDDDLGGETLEETLLRAFNGVLLDTLKLRRYDARKVIRTCPGLLTLRGSKRAESVVTLMTSLGVSVSAIAREKPALPVLLSRAPSAIFRLVAFLASDAVRMDVKAIGPLLRRKECVELLNVIAPVPGIEMETIATESDDEAAKMSDKISAKVWSRNSEIRRDKINDVYRNMLKTAWTLRNQIGTEDLGKVVSSYPSVLLLDAQEQILPTAAYLMNDLGIWEDDLPKVLQLYPVLLGRDMEEMKRTVNYLKDLGVDDGDLPSIFRAFPSLLTMDIETNMTPVVDFLKEIGIVNIGLFITRLPPVLGYSVENELRPKWEFLSKVCLYPSFELSTFPAYFSYPLDRVIKTRYEYLQYIKEAPTQLLALDLVVRYGDKDFAEKVAKDEDRGRLFARFAKRRKAMRTEQAELKRAEAKASKPPKRRTKTQVKGVAL